MAAVTICSDFGAPQNKVLHSFHCFPIYLPRSDGTRCHHQRKKCRPLERGMASQSVFLMLSFKPTFSLSSFTFIKRLLSSQLPKVMTVLMTFHDRLDLPDLELHAVAAAAAKSHQSCPTLCDPRDGSPPGSPVPGILQARTLEWVAISFSSA